MECRYFFKERYQAWKYLISASSHRRKQIKTKISNFKNQVLHMLKSTNPTTIFLTKIVYHIISADSRLVTPTFQLLQKFDVINFLTQNTLYKFERMPESINLLLFWDQNSTTQVKVLSRVIYRMQIIR